MKILVAGELNVDLLLQGYRTFPAPGKEVVVDDLTLTLGSSSAICAHGLARLGNAVAFRGKVGRDPWGDFCVERLNAAGVDTGPVIRDHSLKTGMTVSITSARDRALVTYLGAIEALTESDVPDELLENYAHLHVASFYLQRALRPGIRGLFVRAHRAGLTTSLDPGYDPAETWGRDIVEMLAEVDVFLPNESELRGITGEVAPETALSLLRNERTLTIAKLGRDGSMAMTDGQPVTVPAFEVTPVDTTGAGDSFNAGFLHAWLRGWNLDAAMLFASACGALSTLAAGGTGSQPSEEEVNRFMREALR
jgi:sugar/nucleoside kinase (ribokinase family)